MQHFFVINILQHFQNSPNVSEWLNALSGLVRVRTFIFSSMISIFKIEVKKDFSFGTLHEVDFIQ